MISDYYSVAENIENSTFYNLKRLILNRTTELTISFFCEAAQDFRLLLMEHVFHVVLVQMNFICQKFVVMRVVRLSTPNVTNALHVMLVVKLFYKIAQRLKTQSVVSFFFVQL